MTIVVVHQPQRVVGVLGREAEWIGIGDVERHEVSVGCRYRKFAERGVFVVCWNSARGLVGHKVGNILVAVVEVEEIVSPRDALHPQGAGCNWLGRIPSEGEVTRVVVRAVQPLDAEITVVHEAVVGVCDAVHRLDVFDAPPHTVELHHDVRRFALPQDRAVLAVVGDLPIAGRGLYKRLVPVVVELRQESSGAFRDVRVLVEAVGNICTISAEVERFDAVADVVVLVGVLRQVRGRRVLSP